MLVTEAWRCGNVQIDALRGIVPATVVGARVRCEQPGRPPVHGINLARALAGVAFDPAAARRIDALTGTGAPQLDRVAALTAVEPTSRLIGKALLTETLPDVAIDPNSVLAKLGRGDAVSRQEIATAFLNPPAAAAAATNQQPNCTTRVLQSPIFDDGRLIVFGDPKNAKTIAEALAAAKIKHGPLDDVVVIHTGAFTDSVLLLFVRRIFLEGNCLVARTLDADGNELSRVTATDRVAVHPLPAHWTDPTGPWVDDVTDVLAWTQDPRASGYEPIWMVAKGSEKADRIEIGLVEPAKTDAEKLKQAQSTGLVPPYHLGAFDALGYAEIDRHDSEETEITKERQVLTQILGPGETDDAYLVPDKLYKVTATWSGSRQSGGTLSDTRTFWFRTDNLPPQHLDPWLLLTTPADSEAHAFRTDPVQIVFNTHNVDRLFAAYGKELRVRFTASSANHPPSTPAVPHPFPVVGDKIGKAGSTILSPWEEALQEVVAEQNLTCIPVDIDRTRQSEVTISILLDAYTDFRMDVMMVDIGAPESAEGQRIYRRVFSTGAYDNI